MASKSTRTTRSKAPPVSTTRITRASVKTKDPPASPKKATAKKHLRKKNDSPDAEAPKLVRAGGSSQQSAGIPNDDTEPIKAFLRIRPHLGDDNPANAPYLEQLSDTSVRMNDVLGNVSNPSRYRLSTTPQSSIYSFSHVFAPSTSQSDFFTKTTLPLVNDLLQGQNGLFFAYGVTNSGKTYTMQGGTDPTSAGIIPRTFDVIFNSIGALQSDNRYSAVRLHGVEPTTTSSDMENISSLSQDPALAGVLKEELDDGMVETEVDSTVLQVDHNYSHSVWISYAEVYNEKVYDLLANTSTSSSKPDSRSGPASATLLLTRKALALKSSPLGDLDGNQNNGKYVSGLRQIRVYSAAQAKALLKLGQLYRRVFGTLANKQSSRSHALMTIKLLRGHRGEYEDPTSIQTSRLTLVDLAGSERTKHTQTTGDRLREAGSINKSLMVLGQCMEVMRSNQKRLAQSLASAGRVDTRDVKKTLAVVPFRHSKLTETLMDYFTGDGRVIMIVNVNPYDTGFDENSHVMKFAALTREVLTTRRPVPLTQKKAPKNMKDSDAGENEPHRRKVTISTGIGHRQSEACLDILEEDEEKDDAGYDENGELEKGFVDILFDEIDDLRMQETEMRCALVEAETREEVMREMEERMRNMERMFMKRIMNEVEQNEKKMDAKIDMLHHAGLLGRSRNLEETSHSEDEVDDEEGEVIHLSDFPSDEGNSNSTGRTSSPLDGKSGNQYKTHMIELAREVPLPRSQDEGDSMDSDYEEAALIGSRPKSKQQYLDMAPSPIFEEDVKRGAAVAHRSSRAKFNALSKDMNDLSLKEKRESGTTLPQAKPSKPSYDDIDIDESVVIRPSKGKTNPLQVGAGVVKKPKHQLNKISVYTEDSEPSAKGKRVVRDDH